MTETPTMVKPFQSFQGLVCYQTWMALLFWSLTSAQAQITAEKDDDGDDQNRLSTGAAIGISAISIFGGIMICFVMFCFKSWYWLETMSKVLEQAKQDVEISCQNMRRCSSQTLCSHPNDSISEDFEEVEQMGSEVFANLPSSKASIYSQKFFNKEPPTFFRVKTRFYSKLDTSKYSIYTLKFSKVSPEDDTNGGIGWNITGEGTAGIGYDLIYHVQMPGDPFSIVEGKVSPEGKAYWVEARTGSDRQAFWTGNINFESASFDGTLYILEDGRTGRLKSCVPEISSTIEE